MTNLGINFPKVLTLSYAALFEKIDAGPWRTTVHFQMIIHLTMNGYKAGINEWTTGKTSDWHAKAYSRCSNTESISP